MKFFAVVFQFKDWGNYKNSIGVFYTQAENEEQARANFGFTGTLAIKEISLDDLIKTGGNK